MKKILFMAVMLIIGTLATLANDKRTDEERAKDAQQIVKLIESKKWVFVPNEANMPYGVTIDHMREDNNYFQVDGNKIDIRIDYAGANIRHNMTPMQIRHLIEDVSTNYMYFDTLPPIYIAKCELQDQEVDVSKNNKTVRVKITYETTDTNFTEFGSHHVIDISINTSDLSTSIFCSGLHYEETYFGQLYGIE